MPDKLIPQFYGYIFCALILIALIFFCSYQQLSYGHNWGGDFALYLHQGKSLLNGSQEALAATNAFMVENSSDHNFSPGPLFVRSVDLK